MKGRVAALAAVLAIGASVTACGPDATEQVKAAPPSSSEAPGTTPTQSEPSVYSPPEQTYTPESKPPPKPRLKRTDIKLTVKITSKQCFGSAGCIVEYDIVPAWVNPLGLPIDLRDDYDVTYEVNGDEDGPIIDTFEFYANGKYEVPYGGNASTSSSGQDLTVRITGISEHLGY